MTTGQEIKYIINKK